MIQTKQQMTIKVNFNDTKFTVTKKRRTTDLKALASTRVKIRIIITLSK
jgi:hypothetical protein